MNYNELEDTRTDFIQGKFPFPDEFTVKDLTYKIRSSSSHSIQDMLQGKRGLLVYTTHDRTAARAVGLNQWIVFIWGFKNARLVPVEVKTTSQARSVTEGDESGNPNTIGDVVEIKITNIQTSSPLKGKVDTGATISSLHAEKWTKEGNVVKFVCPELSPNVISVPMIDQQSVQSADGGTEYRPVIELNIKLNDKLMNGVQFNLNDRGKMQYPVLVGQNILEKGGFLIDPRMNENEEIDWDLLQEEFKDIEFPEKPEFDYDDLYSRLETMQNNMTEQFNNMMGTDKQWP